MIRYRYILVFTIGMVLLTIGIFQILFVSLPLNPVQAHIKSQRVFQALAPQGWAFFTRSAREAQVVLYAVQDDSTLVPVPHQHARATNLMGLRRTSTRMLLELQTLKQQLPDELFRNTTWNYQADVYGDVPDTMYTVKPVLLDPVLCGNYVLVLQEHVPWAWSSNLHTIRMPAKVIKFHVACRP